MESVTVEKLVHLEGGEALESAVAASLKQRVEELEHANCNMTEELMIKNRNLITENEQLGKEIRQIKSVLGLN